MNNCLACHGGKFSKAFKDPFVTCDDCGLGQMMDEDRLRTILELEKSGYGKLNDVDGRPSYAPFSEEEKDHKIRLARVIQNKVIELMGRRPIEPSVFEIGFGNGYLLEGFKNLGWRTVGCDISSTACDKVSEVNINVHLGRFEQMPIQEKFTLVLAWDSMEHLLSPEFAFHKIESILVPGGIFAMHSPHLPSYGSDPNHPHWTDKSHLWHMTSQSVIKMASDAGLKPLVFEIGHCAKDPGYCHPQNFCFWAVKNGK